MRSAILTYHSVDDSGSIISVGSEMFRRQMESLVEHKIPVVPLHRILAASAGIALTFDDGYQNFADAALPVLIEFNLPATVFIVSGLCGGESSWKSASGIPRLPLMDWHTLRELPAELIALGSHAVTHVDLTGLPEDHMASELRNSRRQIEDQTGRPVELLAYPYGSSSAAVRAAAQREYALALGTSLSYLHADADRYDLPRLDTYYLRTAVWFDRVAAGHGETYLGLKRLLRNIRRSFP